MRRRGPAGQAFLLYYISISDGIQPRQSVFLFPLEEWRDFAGSPVLRQRRKFDIIILRHTIRKNHDKNAAKPPLGAIDR
jgi:hypothetical protein